MDHAAMCIYCGDTVIYDTREVADMDAAHRALMDHDKACPKNPLAQRIASLERTTILMEDELKEKTQNLVALERRNAELEAAVEEQRRPKCTNPSR